MFSLGSEMSFVRLLISILHIHGFPDDSEREICQQCVCGVSGYHLNAENEGD